MSRSRAERLLEARRRLEEDLDVERRANAEYEAYRARGVMKDGRRFGGPPKPYRPPDTPAGKINLTDPDSRNVKTPRGWVQGYNAQAVTTTDQIVIAAEVTIDSPDFGHLDPMVAAARTDLDYAGVTERLRLAVARGPHFGPGRLNAPSTRQPGLVQAQDIPVTVMSLTGIGSPGGLGGTTMTSEQAPDNSERRAADRRI